MNKENIRCQIAKLNMNLGVQIQNSVFEFLQAFFSRNPVEKLPYQVAAATSIICEGISMPTVDRQSLTSSGVTVENIMSHLGPLSKEEFLQTLQSMAQKSGNENHLLLQKVGKIGVSFRVFKKYKEIFMRLALMIKLKEKIAENLLQLYWILFLLVKKYMKALDDINESTNILISILQEIFCRQYGKIEGSAFMQIIKSQDKFPHIQKPHQSLHNHVINYMKNIIKQLESNRGQQDFFILEKIKTKSLKIRRFVDDASQIYDNQFKALHPSQYIDEITYLQLKKDLTPQVFPSHRRNRNRVISQVLNFQSSQGSQEEEDQDSQIVGNYESSSKNDTPSIPQKLFTSPSFGKMPPNLNFPDNNQQKTSPKREGEKKKKNTIVEYTPVSKGMTKALWIKEFLQSFEVQQVQKLISEYLQNIEFQHMKEELMRKIDQQISKMTPHAQNRQYQIESIWKLFLGLYDLLKSLEVNDEYLQNIEQCIRPLLCLSGCLYNHTLRSLNLRIQKYCNVYEVNIFHFLTTLQKVNRLLLPDLIQDYLIDVEKQILVKQIWETNEGYQFLIENGKKFNESQDNQIYKRLQKKIYQRVKEISQTLHNISLLIRQTDDLVKKVVCLKPILIKQNSLDSIIICSILAVLSHNQIKYSRIISSIFWKYRQTTFKLHIQETASLIGKSQMTLDKYYNQVFIIQINNVLKNQDQNQDFAEYEPLKADSYLQGQRKFDTRGIPPVSKFQEEINPFTFDREPAALGKKPEKNVNRTNKIKVMFQSQQQANIEEYQEQPFSPTFKNFGKKQIRKNPQNLE